MKKYALPVVFIVLILSLIPLFLTLNTEMNKLKAAYGNIFGTTEVLEDDYLNEINSTMITIGESLIRLGDLLDNKIINHTSINEEAKIIVEAVKTGKKIIPPVNRIKAHESFMQGLNSYEQAAEMLIAQEYEQAIILIQNALAYMVEYNNSLNEETGEDVTYL